METTGTTETRKRRTKIPEKPNQSVNILPLIKKFVGTELFNISLPVNFNEPITMLQRNAEHFQYSYLLDEAAQCIDPYKQIAYVSAYAISSYASPIYRAGKPFAPLLGETFEWDRSSDLGWKLLSEQVSLNPSTSLTHCEGKDWIYRSEFTMMTKFKTKQVDAIPLGYANIHFKNSGRSYEWQMVTSSAHNIFIGKMWVDHHGDIKIVGLNNAKNVQCNVNLAEYAYLSRDEPRQVNGVTMNVEDEKPLWLIKGFWDKKVEIAPIVSVSGTAKKPGYVTSEYETIWESKPPADDCEKYYYMTKFACQLNEIENGVAPTDSRLRPDVRLMEETKWDESNIEKDRLEGKQNNLKSITFESIWFKEIEKNDMDYGHLNYEFNEKYWDMKNSQNWIRCPKLFE